MFFVLTPNFLPSRLYVHFFSSRMRLASLILSSSSFARGFCEPRVEVL